MGSVDYVDVEPHMQLMEKVDITTGFDMTKPGKYLVQFTKPVDYEDRNSELVKSNEITITVVPPPQDKPPFTVTITAPATIAAGDQLMIRMTLKNVSNHTIQVYWGDRPFMVVHDEADNEIPVRGEGWGGSMGLVDLEPGTVSIQSVILSGTEGVYDLTKPGKYTVQFGKFLDHDDPKSEIVKSNELTINIVPRNPTP
jgi:hypothetical protein